MNATIVVDLTFGDAGKGSLVDYLVRRDNAHTVIRFNGGAQAAHNVVLPDGRHHTFSQFGSGTFVPGVRTHLSRFMLFDPVALLAEEGHLRSVEVTDAFARLSLDRRALVVTPFQRAVNRLREVSRGSGRHGSCGMGIGEAMSDMLQGLELRAGDLLRPDRLRRRLREIQDAKRAAAAQLTLPREEGSGGLAARELDLLRDEGASAEFAELFAEVAGKIRIVDSSREVLDAPGEVIFEGAQGVLLDEWHGFHPYTTWSTTTFENALEVIRESDYRGEVRRVGVMRAYMTRHGAGPFPTEAVELQAKVPDFHNVLNDWQKAFRVGWLDLPLLRYAVEVTGGIDSLAVTCLDKLAVRSHWKVCMGYRGLPAEFIGESGVRCCRQHDLGYQAALGEALQRVVPEYEEVGSSNVVDFISRHLSSVETTSHGPTWRDKMSAISGRTAHAA